MRFLHHNQCLYNPFSKLSSFSSPFCLMGSFPLCKSTSLVFLSHLSSSSSSSSSYSQKYFLYRSISLLHGSFPVRPTSLVKPFAMKPNGFSSFTSHANVPRPPAFSENPRDKALSSTLLNILRKKLQDLGIDIEACVPGQFSGLLCPMCKGGDSKERSFALHISEDGGAAVWNCFRGKCGWKGHTLALAEDRSSYQDLGRVALKQDLGRVALKQNIRKITVESLQLEPLCDQVVAYFAERLISKETLLRNSVMQKTFGDQIAIAFTYYRGGALVSCKYRDVNKKFWQEANTEKIFYGIDDIEGASDIIIVEGEIDKLSMAEAGIHNCVSVPDGAPPSVSKKDVPSADQDKKYQFLWNCKNYLNKASRIILATDGDTPGQALAEEIARRVGRERCWRVKWPKKNEVDHFKDANEVLMYLGPEALKEVVDNAELYPISGLFNFKDYFHEIDAYYHKKFGFEFGVPTGWNSLNNLYNVVPGELTIVTGVPNSGKSEWIDALLCNLNASVGWKFALCSMENKVREHGRKLLEKHMKKPFFVGRYGGSVERMSVEELEQGKQWLDDTFFLLRSEKDSLPSISWVLDLAKAAVLRHGVSGLVIDPYNELDHQRLPNQSLNCSTTF